MKKLSVILILLITVSGYVSAAESAVQIYEQVCSRLKRAKSIVIEFNFVSADRQSENGTLTIVGDKFKLSSPSFMSLYDGTDLWTANSATNEINVYTPEPEELAEVNPLSILSSGSHSFNMTLLTGPASEKRLKLTPRSSDYPYKYVIVSIDSKTKDPKNLTMTMADNSQATFKVISFYLNTNIKGSEIVFNKKNYKGYKLIDMR